jgi:ferritin-like metal-binding protein YciE
MSDATTLTTEPFLGRDQNMTFVDPERTVRVVPVDDVFAGQEIDNTFVADLLSDMLAHERCGLHLYRSVAGRSQAPALQRGYEHRGEETREHIEILETLIAGLGGQPTYVSPSARATVKMDSSILEATFLLRGSVDPAAAELVMLDAVLMAEARDRANWEGLAALADDLTDSAVRERIRMATNRVIDEEDEHVRWAKTQRAKLLGMLAHGVSVDEADGHGDRVADGIVDRIRHWFSDDG